MTDGSRRTAVDAVVSGTRAPGGRHRARGFRRRDISIRAPGTVEPGGDGLEEHRVDVLGVGISPLTMELALQRIEGWIRNRNPQYICVRDVHGIMASQTDADLMRIHQQAGMVTPDGMPVVWICRRRGYRFVQRVYGPDLLLAACERSLDTGWSHFMFGGAEGVADELARHLTNRFPGLRIAGTLSPPFRPPTAAEDEEVRNRIAASGADIVWVGLSTPKQERWMAEHVGQVGTPVLVGVGAAFDFHSGRKKQAPRWMQRSGLEWLFRLSQEPLRLGPRYLINNPKFVAALLREELSGHRAAGSASPPTRDSCD